MWIHHILEQFKKKPSLLRWLVPGLFVSIMVLWEIVEHRWLENEETLSVTVLLDIFPVAIFSILVGVFATRMLKEIVAKETAQKALRQRNESLIALYTLVTQINQIRSDPDKISAIALDQVLQLMDIEGGGIWLSESLDQPPVFKARRGFDDSYLAAIQQMELKEGLNERVAQTGEPLIVDDVAAIDPVIKEKGLQRCVYVPLRSRREVIGTLRVYSCRQGQFTSQDIALLTTIASQIGVAIEKTRLHQAVHQQLAEITILQGIAYLTSSSLDLEKMLPILVRTLGEVFDYASFSIFLLEAQDLILRAHWASPPPAPASVDIKLCQQAVSTGAPAFVSGGEEPPGQDQIRELSVPLKMKDSTLGVLNIQTDSRQTLGQTDIELFNALANQISLGIYNAQLYAQVNDLNEQLQNIVAERTQQLEASQLEVTQKAGQLQQLLTEVIHIQDEERNRIALDMHDGLTQLVIGALYQSQAAEQALALKPELTVEKLQTTQTLLQQTKDEIHRIVHDLRPPALDRLSLVSAIKRFLDSYRQLVGIPCHLNVSGRVFRLEAKVEAAIYRIVQEAMHNAGKHAQAKAAYVSLDFGMKNVKIVIQDDGVGFDVEAVSNPAVEQVGLTGIKRRAQRLGGQLEIQSAPGQGTRIMLEVPGAEPG